MELMAMSAEFVARSSYNKHLSDRRSPVRFIFSHIRRHPLLIVLLLVGALSNAALAAALFYFVGVAYDAILEWQQGAMSQVEITSVTLWVIAAILGSQVLRSILQFFRNFSAEVYGQRIERDVRDELYSDLLGKSMAFHDKLPIGEVMARVTNDVRELNLMMNPGFNLIIGSGMFLIMPLVFTPAISWQLMWTPFFFMIAYIFAQYYYVSSLHPVAQDVRRSFGNMNANLAESLDGIEIVKGASQQEQEVAKFSSLVDYVYGKYVEQGNLEAIYLPLLMWGLALVVGFLHSLYLTNVGVLQPGDVVRFMGYLSLFGFPVFVSQFSFSQVALGYASTRRILNILNTTTTLDQNAAGYDVPMQGALTFENVSFHYDEGKTIIHDVSFDVEPGQTVAVVGQTGAGKSTIMKLINRTYDVSGGMVKIDGHDVKDWNLAALRSQISIIEQDIFLFSKTIAQNIAFGVENATQEEIEQAAKMAQAHDFILSFPNGYETVIGQRGVTLSGGQRQRLAIARAFLTDPKILILDDSTSAIDSATEDKIQQAIWTAAKGRTTLLITHRLSQIRWADHIVVIKKGHVVAQGKHEDLLQTSTAYQRIFARYDKSTSNSLANDVPTTTTSN
jgi:ATP-binding cassette, subfamily B, bacterial